MLEFSVNTQCSCRFRSSYISGWKPKPNWLRDSHQYFSQAARWQIVQMEDRKRQRCVIDKLWIPIPHFQITNSLNSKYKTQFPIDSDKIWCTGKWWTNYGVNKKLIRYPEESHTVLAFGWRRGRSSWIYCVDHQNISPVELWIYSMDLNFTPTTQGLEGCPQRCSCRSSNTSENIRSVYLQVRSPLEVQPFLERNENQIWKTKRKYQWLPTRWD